MIKLFFETFRNKEIEARTGEKYEVIRLSVHTKFKTSDGFWSKIYDAIINTGAHALIIPFNIWKELEISVITNYEISGLNPKKECSVPAIIGKVKGILLDDEENQSKEIEMTAFLVYTSEIPLIIGFKNLLSEFEVCFNYKKNKAYLIENSD